jgi:hypothetical protein
LKEEAERLDIETICVFHVENDHNQAHIHDEEERTFDCVAEELVCD